MKVIDEESVPAAEARNSLSKKKDDENLSYEQKICIDFLGKNVKMNVTDTRDAMKELQEVGRIKPRQAAMLVNILPENRDEVRLVFSKETMNLSQEEMDEIIDIIDKYR